MKKALLGNEAIAYGLMYAGVDLLTGYPGTPSSEIIKTYQKIVKDRKLKAYSEWSVNEKVAFESAYAGAISGKRTACTMKMVGLNVAMDPLMSSAFIGNRGGFLVISADDPGVYSSQTEQDSRSIAKFARLPVLDPSSPEDAFRLTVMGIGISERFEVPLILRPVLRVCHGRQIVDIPDFQFEGRVGKFERNVGRWAAIPRIPRLKQEEKLFQKLKLIADFNYENLIEPKLKYLNGKKALIITSGSSYGFVSEVVNGNNVNADILKIDMPYPLPIEKLKGILSNYKDVVVFEETYPVMEEQLRFKNVRGKLTGDVFRMDEITHDKVADTLVRLGYLRKNPYVGKPYKGKLPQRKPSLCPGCPHRTVFYSIKKVFGEDAIYPSDIGCYTLGINQNAVDTVLCMGASAGMSNGFSESDKRTVVATIGDSTFLHAGIPPLINAVANKHRFVLVVLDNQTVAMTGLEPTPESTGNVKIENIVKGCGVEPLILHYDGKIGTTISFFKMVKNRFENSEFPVVAVVKQFCLFDKVHAKLPGRFAKVDPTRCKGCGYCIENFGCPAFNWEDGKVKVDPYFCSGCGVCLDGLCPFDAFVEVKR